MSVYDVYGGFGVFDWIASVLHQGMFFFLIFFFLICLDPFIRIVELGLFDGCIIRTLNTEPIV